jgi:predicted transposase/invertase (TIGR01784 family)
VTVIGICPTVDFAFKLLFGSPEHARITIHFLNAILGQSFRISSITIRNPFLGKATEDDKLSILDILAIDEHGRIINIEIQTTIPAGMHQRLTYYVSSLYSEQLTQGANYTSLRPAISICVLTKPMYVDDQRLHLDFRLRDKSGLLLTDDLQVHLLQLSKLTVTAQNITQASSIEKWAYFLLNAEKMTLDDVRRLFLEIEFAEAAGVLNMISQNPEQRQLYEARLKFQRDEAARLEGAINEGIEKGISQGRVLGHQQGHQQGLLEGLQEGHLEGLKEGLEKGTLIGRITTLHELLGIVEPTAEALMSFSEAQLSELAESLKRQLRTRG